MVDGVTGSVLWQAGSVAPTILSPGEVFQTVAAMTFAIPSDVSILDRNSDGYADRVYVGDTGGNAWRADINDLLPANWTVNKLARLGFAASAAQITAATAALSAAKGWFITLLTGEEVISSSVTLGGATFFNTNQPTPPAPGVCGGNLGAAREYTVNFQTGGAVIPYDTAAGLTAASRYVTHPGGGYTPSPVGAIVQIGGTIQQVVISGTSVLQPPASPIGARIRTFWNQK